MAGTGNQSPVLAGYRRAPAARGIQTRAAHREDVFTSQAAPQNDLLCCPVAWPAGRASRCNSVMLAALYRLGAGVRLACLA